MTDDLNGHNQVSNSVSALVTEMMAVRQMDLQTLCNVTSCLARLHIPDDDIPCERRQDHIRRRYFPVHWFGALSQRKLLIYYLLYAEWDNLALVRTELF